MSIKPYKHKGRFYNHAKEKLFYRMVEMFRNFSRTVFLELITGKAKKKFWDDCPNRYEWIKPMSFDQNQSDLSIMWLGHATFLMRLGGLTIMIDPVFFDVSSLLPRYVFVPLDLDAIPPVDVILISHDHRDHLDIDSLRILNRKGTPLILVPEGTKQFLEKHGINRVSEFSWSGTKSVPLKNGKIMFTFLPAIHWTGRGLFDINKALWGSWLIEYDNQRVYFAGDTAYGPHFAEIKKMAEPITVAIMPIGPNEPHEKLLDSHVCAYEAVKAFIELGAEHFIPMHWGTFKVNQDSFLLPIQRLEEAWQANHKKLQGKQLHIMKFGEIKQFPPQFHGVKTSGTQKQAQL
jgi:L-ascorbate metabolism protein UlaG (beta-lactamase superfamily)